MDFEKFLQFLSRSLKGDYGKEAQKRANKIREDAVLVLVSVGFVLLLLVALILL